MHIYLLRILQCGLKGFVGNFNSTLDSEVGILGYLSFAHENDLKFALKEMLEVRILALHTTNKGSDHHTFIFQAVFYQNSSSVQPHVNTLPYFMHLCSMSEILLQPIINVFLELCKYFKVSCS